MFASTELAARIEAADCRLLRDAAEAFDRHDPSSDLYLREVAGGLAAFTSEGMPFNKLAGLGFSGVPDDPELEEIEDAFRARTKTLQVEVSSLADPGVAERLSRRGYVLVGVENLLGRELPIEEGSARPGERIEISRVEPDQLDTWIDVLVTGFGSPDDMGVPSHESFGRELLERAIGLFARTEGMRQYLVTRDGAPAGGGGVRLTDGVAQMTGAATLPEHRRRGIQSLLLSRRLADAAEAGCDVAVVTTQPGSKSHENVHRRGFELLYVRSILVKEL